MKSHRVEFTLRDLAALAGAPLAIVAVFSAVLHAGVALSLLPAPRPTFNTDQTVVVHQVEASRQRTDAEIVMVGDSSCLMDVDARQLGTALGRRVLNLGTISHLDLAAHALLLGEFTRANPGRPRCVVLLMHPEALRRVESERWALA